MGRTDRLPGVLHGFPSAISGIWPFRVRQPRIVGQAQPVGDAPQEGAFWPHITMFHANRRTPGIRVITESNAAKGFHHQRV